MDSAGSGIDVCQLEDAERDEEVFRCHVQFTGKTSIWICKFSAPVLVATTSNDAPSDATLESETLTVAPVVFTKVDALLATL